MENQTSDIAQRKVLLTAGFGLFFMTLLAVGSISLIFQQLIVPDDAIATTNNILAGEMQFRIGIICFVIIAILDVLVAWALYILFIPVNRYISLLAAWFRLIYAGVLCVALFSYVEVLQIVNSADYLTGVKSNQMHVDLMMSLRLFDDGWALGLVFFGFHLMLLGYLVFKSDFVPIFFGFVLIAGGISYVFDSFGRFVFPDLNLKLVVFLGWGEVLFMIWLMYRSFSKQKD